MNLNFSPDNVTITDSTIIIHWNFNKPIDLTNCNCTQLIFSNYLYVNICIKVNNEYNEKYQEYWKQSQFNQLIFIPNLLTHLTFGWNFNQIINLTNNIQLKYLTFGWYFNQLVK